MTIAEYINEINKEYKTGRATEHSYRGYLQNLIKSISTDVMVTNEPTRVKCGAPDYIITKRDIPIGYIEAKDIGCKLDDKVYKEQFDRYRKSLTNLIITDYIDFWLYIDGELIKKVRIAEATGSGIKSLPEHHSEFTNLVKDFCTYVGQTIKSSKKLAEMMAGKARMLSEVIEKSLVADEADTLNPDTALQAQLHAFKDILIHDITPKEFADIYAQTIAYGMFAARLHDPTLPTFSRQEAAELIPKTNPFLRKLFQYIAGFDLDQRLVWIVDSLAEIFRATDVAALLKNFGKSTRTNDPMIHFYETFLSEYDPALRKARGVWYTPEPVVDFIVRGVDDILKSEFNLSDGLADISKTKIKVKTLTKATDDMRSKIKEKMIERTVHKVQILDPATGTGTFLADVVKHIHQKFEGQQGVWKNYVDEHLIPRLNGFELLMASYAMAHLKLDMLLTETGYNQENAQRFKVYLTNSLEEHHPDTGTLFANWLSAEANEANYIKRDTPVMVILGNPPYNGESKNKGKWIMELMKDYKKEPGGKEKLKEKNSKFVNDDYVKFIRFSQYFIEKNGSGVLAFINPHGYLDNPTYRGMRWNLLKTFDKIYTIDLHGNVKKKEKCPDGSPDVNVFDIEQGVSINFFIKTGNKKDRELGKVFHFDLYGKREVKYDYLFEHNIESTPYKEISYQAPDYFFRPKNFEEQTEHRKGFYLPDLFKENSLGVLSKNDDVTIDFDRNALKERINYFINHDESDVRQKYAIKKDSRDWVLSRAIKDLKDNFKEENFKNITYRPFDNRWTYFTGKPKGFFAYTQERVMRNMREEGNLALISGRQGQAVGSMQWNLAFVTNQISEQNIYYRGGGTVFPLYLYPERKAQQAMQLEEGRKPNLNPEIVGQISQALGLSFTNEKEQTKDTFAPVDIFDYIYAVLYSGNYRDKYSEFLKIDFPRIPFPKAKDVFWQLVKLGGELRSIHLFNNKILNTYITKYPIAGSNEIEKYEFENNQVLINEKQYFEGVSDEVWNFYIGGYQPAQKWLKDRKGRLLSFEEISHYQKIIVALSETIQLMNEIDKVQFLD